jgi:integrase
LLDGDGQRAKDIHGRPLPCPKLKSSRHGTWYFAIDLPATPDGKRRKHRRGGFATEAAARIALDDLRRRLGVGQEVNDRQTVGQWLESWFAGKRNLRSTTARGYRAHLDSYLLPHLGTIPLEHLRAAHVAEMLRVVETGQGGRRALGGATVRRVHATLRSALNAAVKQQRISINPAVHVELPEMARPKVHPWEADELGAFLDYAATDRLGAMYELIAMTGLRRGEACGLRWIDVDHHVVRYESCAVGPDLVEASLQRRRQPDVDLQPRTTERVQSESCT